MLILIMTMVTVMAMVLDDYTLMIIMMTMVLVVLLVTMVMIVLLVTIVMVLLDGGHRVGYGEHADVYAYGDHGDDVDGNQDCGGGGDE